VALVSVLVLLLVLLVADLAAPLAPIKSSTVLVVMAAPEG
jgi:hypothetical protein